MASMTQETANMALEWRVSDAPVAYDTALQAMDARVQHIRDGSAVS